MSRRVVVPGLASVLGVAVVALALAVAAPASAYTLLGADWTWEASPCDLPWYFNPSGFTGTSSSTELEDAFTGGIDAWNDAGAEFRFEYGGTTSASSSSYTYDGVMDAGYYTTAPTSSTLALDEVWYDSSYSYIGECDIFFFGDLGGTTVTWSAAASGAPSGQYDVQKVATHELGHCVGLDHSSDSSAIMYYATDSGSSGSSRTLATDDVDGILAIYGAGSPDVQWYDAAVVDDGTYGTTGDGDGVAERGETVAIDVSLENAGYVTASSVSADLATTSSFLTLLSTSADYGDVGELDVVPSSYGTGPYLAEVDAGCKTDSDARLGLTITDADGDSWSDTFTVPLVCVFDADGDGYDDTVDCDDASAAVHPGAAETWYDGVDGDCQGDDDYDQDGDGHRPAAYGGDDCDDTDATAYPGASETCDGADDDCDGQVDEDVEVYWWPDADHDGHGDPDGESVKGCTGPAGYASEGDDCDDTIAGVHPGATEVCDGLDEDCDGVVDDGLTSPFFADADGDGFGDPDVEKDACKPPKGYVADATDCDDGAADVSPAGTETCDGRDEDCDGTPDDGLSCDTDGGLDTGTGPEPKGGCGCATGGAEPATGILAALLTAVSLRRRRDRS